MDNLIIKNVFLLKSPLQLLNAIEARRHFGLLPGECLLILVADRKSQGQLINMIEAGEAWGGIVSLPSSKLSPVISSFQPGDSLQRFGRRYPLFGKPMFSVLKLRILAQRYRKVESVFIGDQKNALMRHFSNLAATEDVVALDDGTATIKYARERCAGEDGRPSRLGKRLGRFLKYLFFGLRDAAPEKLTFFSVYSVVLPQKDHLVLNDYSYLRKNIAAIKTTQEVYFLGAPLVESGVLSEDQYLWHLTEAQRCLGGQSVIYVRHRREDPERVRRIGHKLGWETTLFDFPIEYQLSQQGPRPEKLVSFFSSALENCRLIFGDMMQIVAFRLSPEQMTCKGTPEAERVEMVYRHYEGCQSPSFQVVRL